MGPDESGAGAARDAGAAQRAHATARAREQLTRLVGGDLPAWHAPLLDALVECEAGELNLYRCTRVRQGGVSAASQDRVHALLDTGWHVRFELEDGSAGAFFISRSRVHGPATWLLGGSVVDVPARAGSEMARARLRGLPRAGGWVLQDTDGESAPGQLDAGGAHALSYLCANGGLREGGNGLLVAPRP